MKTKSSVVIILPFLSFSLHCLFVLVTFFIRTSFDGQKTPCVHCCGFIGKIFFNVQQIESPYIKFTFDVYSC